MARAILFATLLASVQLSACTSHVRVPRTAVACANACEATQTTCLTDCATSRGNAAVVEDVRQYLCEKRCRQTYEDCVLACPGVQ